MFLSVSVSSQSITKENTIVRSFALADDTEIEVTNKYGDINIENWDKDSIKIEIIYKVTSVKESRLNLIYDAINFDFKANQYYVYVKTIFEGRGSFWFDVTDIASNLFAAGTHTSIDYTIYIPANRDISLNLKYGNVYMTNHSGHFKLELSNGDFKAHSLSGDTDLDVMFGDISVKNLTKGMVNLRYGTFGLENADYLSLTGQSSEFDFGTINELVVDSKRDKISLEEVNILTGQNYFTRLVIDEIGVKLDLSTKYGSIKLKEIGAQVKNVQLSSYNTSVSLYFQKDNNYFINLVSDDKADVTYSANIGEFTTKKLPGKEKLMQAECLIGDKNLAIPIDVDIKSGFVTLKMKE